MTRRIPCNFVHIPPPGLHTKLKPITQKFIDEKEAVIADRLNRLAFYGTDKRPIPLFDGRLIHTEGIAYAGSKRNSFWSGFLEPYLEDAIQSTLSFVMKECETRSLEPPRYMAEARWLLECLVERAYVRLDKIDRTLLNAQIAFITINRPELPPPKDIQSRISAWKRYIQEYSDAVSLKGPELPRPAEMTEEERQALGNAIARSLAFGEEPIISVHQAPTASSRKLPMESRDAECKPAPGGSGTERQLSQPDSAPPRPGTPENRDPVRMHSYVEFAFTLILRRRRPLTNAQIFHEYELTLSKTGHPSIKQDTARKHLAVYSTGKRGGHLRRTSGRGYVVVRLPVEIAAKLHARFKMRPDAWR